jgi:hypothetical protein
VVLTRSDWKTLKIIPLATPHPAPAFADMTADRDSWQKQASQFLDDALEFARQRDEVPAAVREAIARELERMGGCDADWFAALIRDIPLGKLAAAITQSMEGKTT